MALRRSSEERRGEASAFVILGLANPGSEYEGSRHNVGGDAVRELARRNNVSLKVESRQRCALATITAPTGAITLAVPTTFMNESGAALPGLLKRSSLRDWHYLIVVHDELDMEPGRLQFKFGGGLAGHNGLRSVAAVLKTQDFARLRIGIGRPPRKEMVTDYVLKAPRGASKEQYEQTVQSAADALEALVAHGFDEAQRRVNIS